MECFECDYGFYVGHGQYDCKESECRYKISEKFEDTFEEFVDDTQLSPHGINQVGITDEQIEMLKEGKTLIFNDGEYSTLVKKVMSEAEMKDEIMRFVDLLDDAKKERFLKFLRKVMKEDGIL